MYKVILHIDCSDLGDLLENYCKTDDLMNVARLCFAVTIMLTYPLECFVVRHVSIYLPSTQVWLLECFVVRHPCV